MDTFAHAIQSFIIFQNTELIGFAIFFGVMPDLFSWTIYIIYRWLKGERFESPKITEIPEWVFFLYGFTHSIFVFAATALIIYILIGFIPVYLLAWIIHIGIDIPTHSRKFLPTPFLWPISDWKFPGFSWGQKWFMITNWSAIIITLLLIFFIQKKGEERGNITFVKPPLHSLR